jgi:uncharacterized RDD family membrane protein YckC
VEPQPAGAVTAGLGRRLASLSYELLLLTAILFVSGWAFLGVGTVLDPVLARPLLQLWLLAVAAVYFVYCWTHNGQTLPMKTWRMRMVMRDGRALHLRQGIKRFLFALLSIGLCGLGWAWALFDPDRQFLHDRLAGTKIVKTGA